MGCSLFIPYPFRRASASVAAQRAASAKATSEPSGLWATPERYGKEEEVVTVRGLALVDAYGWLLIDIKEGRSVWSQRADLRQWIRQMLPSRIFRPARAGDVGRR